MKFITEVYPNVNNYKTHQITEIELASLSAEVTGTPPASTGNEPTLSTNIIPDANENSNRENGGRLQGDDNAAPRMVYDAELGVEMPTGITDAAEGEKARSALFENDPVLKELERQSQAGEISLEKEWLLSEERTDKLEAAFKKANPALYNKNGNVEGVTNDGTEGNGVSDAGGQRYDGTGTGEQVGSVDGSAGEAARTGQTAKRGGAAVLWQPDDCCIWTKKESTESALG